MILGGVLNTSDINTAYRINRNFSLSYKEYINSGILLFDTHEFTLNKIKLKCIKLSNILRREILAAPDQDIINLACGGKILIINEKWNFQWHHLWDKKEDIMVELYNKFMSAKQNIGILHFTSEIKPWKNPERPYAYYFWKYARLTPVYEAILFLSFSQANGHVSPFLGFPKTIGNSNKDELNKITSSISFRIGRFITFIPRKIRGGIRCYKENGMQYTLNRAKAKFRRLVRR